MEDVFSDVTFTNDRQKADVNVVKKDNDTENPISGGILALYAGSDIANADGTVVVKKGTLIEKATTGADRKAAFIADLPIVTNCYRGCVSRRKVIQRIISYSQ